MAVRSLMENNGSEKNKKIKIKGLDHLSVAVPDLEKAIEFYADEGDSLILISAGGNSPNMINGAKRAKEKKIRKIITFTGNDKNNNLTKHGDINFWVDSKAYNHIENIHQILLLSLVDLIIGKTEYPPN